jgi:hypothetical protein
MQNSQVQWIIIILWLILDKIGIYPLVNKDGCRKSSIYGSFSKGNHGFFQMSWEQTLGGSSSGKIGARVGITQSKVVGDHDFLGIMVYIYWVNYRDLTVTEPWNFMLRIRGMIIIIPKWPRI